MPANAAGKLDDTQRSELFSQDAALAQHAAACTPAQFAQHPASSPMPSRATTRQSTGPSTRELTVFLPNGSVQSRALPDIIAERQQSAA
jgi:hypothetical protein